jgi:hypothetical protein
MLMTTLIFVFAVQSKEAIAIGRSGMPKHEKPPMAILVKLPLDFQ